ncbi:unnamed protein product [Caenorhabditis nigoni]
MGNLIISSVPSSVPFVSLRQLLIAKQQIFGIPPLPTYEEAMGSPSSPPPSYENFHRIVSQLGGATVIRSRRPRRDSRDFPPYQISGQTTATISNRRGRRATDHRQCTRREMIPNGGLSAVSRTSREDEATPSDMVDHC